MIYLLLCLLVNGKLNNAEARSIEYKLHEKLFNGYDKTIRPVADVRDKLDVELQPILYSLLQVDERMGSMKFLQWLQTMWRDSNMRWDPSEFENVISTHIPSKALWRPDIAVYNQMVEIEYPQAREDILAEVFYDGTVKLVYLQALEIRCHGFDLSQFPFDQQTCTTRYGSWAQSNEQILLTTGKVIEQDNQFRNHSEWDIVSFIGRTEDVTYSSKILLRNPNGTERLLNDTKIFRELHYDLTLKRKASFYIFTLVLPSIITTTICLIGLFAPFDASGNREEKVTLGLTTMLSMIMLLMLVANEMPRSGGNHPLIGNFILFEIGLCTAATVTTVIIMCIHQRMELQANEPPRHLLRFAYTALCIKETIDWSENDTLIKLRQRANNAERLDRLDSIPSDSNGNILSISALNQDRALNELLKMTLNIKRKAKYASIKYDWVHIFRLIDYICMFVYNLINLVVSFVVFF